MVCLSLREPFSMGPKHRCDIHFVSSCPNGATPTWVWCAPVGDDLSQQDSKRPDIGLDGEGAVVDSFRRRPFDGELGSWFAEAFWKSPFECFLFSFVMWHVAYHEWNFSSQHKHCVVPSLAVYSLSSMIRARPKSAILQTKALLTRMLAARRSRWM